MKIAWYTPFSIDSAIGHYSQLVVAALRRIDVEVDIVRSEERTSAVRSRQPICKQEKTIWAADFGRSIKQNLAGYDLVVYNVGDYFDYHAHCINHQQVVPGLSILHDFSLHSALNHYCHETAPHNGTYRDQLDAEVGESATQAYDHFLADEDEHDWWQNASSRFPVYRWALRQTLGVVTHAEFYRDVVSERLGCPVTTIPLAYDSPLGTVQSPTLAADDRFILLTVGSVNANKRYRSVIEAIGSSPQLRERVQYRIVGDVNESGRQQIEAAVRAQAGPVDVAVLGRVQREQLEAELHGAHAISCLRFPALEGASASVIEAMLSSRPVLVSRTGCYREIPSQFVYPITPQNEVAELTTALESIVGDYPTAIARGKSARDWTLSRHSADAYADQLLRFVPEILYNQPVIAVADRVAEQLKRWQPSVVDDVLMERMDRAMTDLFGNQPADRRAA